ncbi:hypothetical protein ACFYTS_14890 [Nocardia sp. NPDC004151]|uniref:hypothetical protein n=1 Tax=Nocardia sp. NPDC004151 TaxID=3364304 RepID=UPI0036C1C889
MKGIEREKGFGRLRMGPETAEAPVLFVDTRIQSRLPLPAGHDRVGRLIFDESHGGTTTLRCRLIIFAPGAWTTIRDGRLFPTLET